MSTSVSSGYDSSAAAADAAAEAAAAEEERRRAEEEARRQAEEAAKKAAQQAQQEAQREETQRANQEQMERVVQNSLGSNVSATTVENIFGDDFYNDNYQLSAAEALQMANGSSIYDGHMADHLAEMAANIEDLQNNSDWRITMDSDGDGDMESLTLVEAHATTFDSELDLYIQYQFEQVVAECLRNDGHGHKTSSVLSTDSLAKLAAMGIRVDAIGDADSDRDTNLVYSISLVEMPADCMGDPEKAYHYLYETEEGKNAKVLEDANGKKGSYIFGDDLIPDGYAQSAERDFGSVLDLMGYDCISKADFIGREDDYYKLIQEVQSRLDNGEYGASTSINDIYGKRSDAHQSVINYFSGNSHAPGYYGHKELSGGGSGSKADPLSKKAEREDEERREAATRTTNIELYKAILIEQYKEEHDGNEPVGNAMAAIEARAKAMANA